ncbi:MAG: hypothetical protein K2V38_10900 [Gemmataceae bacterium]|nr:hypothetical protein [Gemmataceae bacterium]
MTTQLNCFCLWLVLGGVLAAFGCNARPAPTSAVNVEATVPPVRVEVAPPPRLLGPTEIVTTQQEIQRLKNAVKLLDEDAKQLLKQLAKERVEVESLKTKTDELAEKQAKEKARLLARGEEIKKREAEAVPGTQAAKADLQADVQRFGIAQKTLASHEELLVKRIKVCDSVEKQFEAVKDRKRELTAAVEILEVEIALLKIDQAEGKFRTDDARLAKIKDDLRALGEKINVKINVKREEVERDPIEVKPAPKAGQTVDEIIQELRALQRPALKE